MNPKLFWLVTAILLVVRGHPSQAQQSRKTPPRIGFLSGASLASTQDRIDAFRQALRGLGYVEGKNLLIDWRFADGSRLHMVAERAHWINRHWVFTNVQEFHYPPNVDYPTKTVVTETNLPRMMETPRLITSEIKISGLETLKSLRKTQISSAAILDYLQLHPQLDEKKRDSLLTLLHSRLAAPWTCFVVVLIAIPFGALPGRRNVFVGVASSITICFIFFVVKDLTLALGSGGHVPAWIAAWVPNVAFALAGLALLWRVR